MLKYTLSRNGQFFRGTLHVHTTLSDGDLTPEQTKELYKKNGYDFIALTDHNRYGIHAALNDDKFLVMPGVEIDSRYYGNIHHVVGISTPERTKYTESERYDREKLAHAHPQVLIDELLSHGNMAIYAHPMWSYCDAALLAELQGLTGMEIINYSCEQEWKSGQAEYYYEYLCTRGSRLWCFGADDAHGHVPDYMGGYITVKAEKLTHEAIFEAIQKGSFYASFARATEKAPEIIDFTVEDGIAKIDTSPCRNIHINAYHDRRGREGFAEDIKLPPVMPDYEPAHGTEENPLTHHEWKLPPDTKSVRAIVSDFRGLVSWTQPIKL